MEMYKRSVNLVVLQYVPLVMLKVFSNLIFTAISYLVIRVCAQRTTHNLLHINNLLSQGTVFKYKVYFLIIKTLPL